MPATNRRDYLRERAAALLAVVATYTGGFASAEGEPDTKGGVANCGWRLASDIFSHEGHAEGTRTEDGEAMILARVYVKVDKGDDLDAEISRVTELVERAIYNAPRPARFDGTYSRVTIRRIGRELVTQIATRTTNTAEVIIPITFTYTQQWKVIA